MKIAVIDDEQDICHILSMELTDLGYQPIVFTSAIAAQNYFLQATVDLIICDYQMPQLNGVDLFKWLLARNSPTPFIILTAEVQLDRQQLMQLGIAEVLYKPQGVELLPALLAKLLSH